MTDNKEFAEEVFHQLKVVILNTYAKSHGIKIGKSKKKTIENIMARCDRWELHISAVPGSYIGLQILFTPVPKTKTTSGGGSQYLNL